MKTIKDKILNHLDIICFHKLFDYLRSPQDFTFNIDFTGPCNDFNLPGKREGRICQDKFNLFKFDHEFLVLLLTALLCRYAKESVHGWITLPRPQLNRLRIARGKHSTRL